MSEDNITRLWLGNKEVILIGTAHVSSQSADQVKEVIEQEAPSSVCIELDEQRYESLQDDDEWKDTDIFKIIKEKRATLLLMNLVISSFQKRIAKQFGINPGQEMIQGIQSAEETGAELVLADRNIQITFSRIWGNLGWTGKAKLLMQIIGSIFVKEDISEEELEKMKSQDMLDSMLHELTQHFPRLKTPLIDERDQYLAQNIKSASGDKVVAVLGAAHVPGVTKEIHKEHDLTELARRPKKSKAPKVIAWAIPIVIVSIILYTFLNNPSAGLEQTLSWIIWNGAFSAIGTIAALGHPLTILASFIVAPITSLNPVIAAGWFAGIVQAFVKKPVVSDFESLSDDVHTVKGFWNNRVTRILLIVVLANIGSSIGTFIGGADVLRVFFENL